MNDPPLRLRGHSKDHPPREPQAKLGLGSAVDTRVVVLHVTAGHVHDQRLTLDLLTSARARLPGVALVAEMDSGMGGSPNLQATDTLSPPVDRLSAVPLRCSKLADERLLARAGRWAKHPYREGFEMRSVVFPAERSPSGRAERSVATRSLAEAEKQRRLLDKELARIKVGLKEDNRVDGHGKPVCKLLANSKRRRLLRRSARGDRWLLDAVKVRVERRRAGVHVARSTLVDRPIETTLRV